MKGDEITFSFGENWNALVDVLEEEDLQRARADIEEWLGAETVSGKRVVDVGSGSGIHSLGFHTLGAAEVHSFDFDPNSVAATRRLHELAGAPGNWKVEHGSVLDEDYVRRLGQFDIAYSWGVLHHTGAMWDAIDNCMRLVRPGGRIWISLYAKGPRYESDLALKRRFNRASALGKKWMIARRIAWLMAWRLRHGKNPFAWNEKQKRGMNVYHDIVDWLGGLPYETATEEEVLRFGRERGFVLEHIRVAPEGGCSDYIFSLSENAGEAPRGQAGRAGLR